MISTALISALGIIGSARPRTRASCALGFLLPLLFPGPGRAGFTIDVPGKGKADQGGTFSWTVSWTTNGVKHQSKVSAAVTAGDDAEKVRDAVEKALTTDPMFSADFTFSKDSTVFGGGHHYVSGAAKKGKTVEISSIFEDNVANNGKTIKGIGVGGGENGDPPFSMVHIFGDVGSRDETLTIFLDRPSDTTLANPVPFSLPSYEGLTPSQVATGLAALINADGAFDATVVGGDRIRIVGQNPLFGVAGLDEGGQSLCYDCLTAVPEPGSSVLLGLGLMTLLLSARSIGRRGATRPGGRGRAGGVPDDAGPRPGGSAGSAGSTPATLAAALRGGS